MYDAIIRMILRTSVIGFAVFASFVTNPAYAQNPFAPIVRIDNGQVSTFMVEQRLNFLTTLQAPNVTRESVIEALTNEFLQVRAARAAGIVLESEDFDAGLQEFALRANATPEELLAFLEQNNIPEQTVRDFVGNGLLWRRLVQQQFGALSQVSEAELDRAIALTSGGGVRVLLSEIALPLAPQVADQNRDLAQQLADTIQTPTEFAQAAANFSAAPSAGNGGALDWLDLNALPGPVASELLVMAPGEITEPIDMGSYVALFLIRDFQETAGVATNTLAVEYAEIKISEDTQQNARSLAQGLKDRSDTCDDLYGTAKDFTTSDIVRVSRQPSDLPRDVALTLAKLDPGEIMIENDPATANTVRFIMLCGRTPTLEEGAREALRQRLFAQRLEAYASGYLDELKAEARITRLDENG